MLVTVEEAPATTIGYGGGLEATQPLRATGDGRAGRASSSSSRRAASSTSAAATCSAPIARSTSTRASASVRRIRPTTRRRTTSRFGFSEYRVVGTLSPAALVRAERPDASPASSSRACEPASTSRGEASTPTWSGACTPRCRGQRPLFVQHDADVRRAVDRGRSGDDRPPVPAGPAVGVLRRHRAATRATICSIRRAAVPQRRGHASRRARSAARSAS